MQSRRPARSRGRGSRRQAGRRKGRRHRSPPRECAQDETRVSLHGRRLIPRNVAASVKAPRPGKKEIRPLTQDQARGFLKAARGDRFEALYVLAIHCGLREGELLGLKWEDVDLGTGTLAVHQTLSETKERGHVFEPPKNGKERNIKLTVGATKALKRHRKVQLEERMRLAGLWEDHGLVFPNQVVRP